MNRKIVVQHLPKPNEILLTLALVITSIALIPIAPGPAYAQSVDERTATDPAATVQARIERARALAAAHQLPAAASELEAVRAGASDDSVRNVTSVMLMNIYLEEGNYLRAESLLDETFRTRVGREDRSIRTYFALAGQAVNGARAHLARYRSFGINVSDSNLPPEALGDLDRLRSLLERMIVQARIINQDNSNTYDSGSLALLEDVLSIRLSLARNSEEREKWGNEYALARHGLASSQNQLASLKGLPSLARPSGTTGSSSESTDKTVRTAQPDTTGTSDNQKAQQTSEGSQSTGDGVPSANESDTTISAGLLNGRAEKKVVPSYPQIARSAGVSGVVRVHVGVNEGGRVTSVYKSEGPALLHQAAEDAARKWTFPPTLINGQPAKITGFIEFKFTF